MGWSGRLSECATSIQPLAHSPIALQACTTEYFRHAADAIARFERAKAVSRAINTVASGKI